MMFDHKSSYFFGDAVKFWFMFVLVGLFGVVSPYVLHTDISYVKAALVGGIFMVGGAALRFIYEGVQIDTENKRYREYTAFFGIITGKWIALPDIHKLVLTSKNVSYWGTPNGITPTFKFNTTFYTIALFDKEDQLEIFMQTEKEKRAKNSAKILSEKLDLPVDQV